MPDTSRTTARRRVGRGWPVVIAVVAVLVMAALAEAHDFWLVPNAFANRAGAHIEIRGQTSSRFPTSESAVTIDRVADARLIGASTVERIVDLSISGKSLRLRHRPATPGQQVIAVRLHPRSVRESAAGFRRYLELEGAPDALARVDREGLLRGRDSVTRRYAKYAKTIVEVGRDGPRAFARTADHPLEFVPEQDPATLAVGDTLRARLLYRGQALAGIRIHADAVEWRGSRTTTPARSTPAGARAANPQPAEHHVTDAEGNVRVAVTRPGLWNIRTIHLVQSDSGSGADWDTHWATLVFHASGGGSRR